MSQKTEGKIQDLLLEQDVDSLTKMILINVIYFKGLFFPNFNRKWIIIEIFSAQWKKAFNVEESFYQFFNSPLAGEVNHTFMNIDDQFRIYEDPEAEFEILELPYADETMSMLIVLPSSPTVQISSKLEGFNFSAIRELEPRDARVSIPKFNMKYQTYLKKKISDLGAPDLFSANSNLEGKDFQATKHLFFLLEFCLKSVVLQVSASRTCTWRRGFTRRISRWTRRAPRLLPLLGLWSEWGQLGGRNLSSLTNLSSSWSTTSRTMFLSSLEKLLIPPTPFRCRSHQSVHQMRLQLTRIKDWEKLRSPVSQTSRPVKDCSEISPRLTTTSGSARRWRRPGSSWTGWGPTGTCVRRVRTTTRPSQPTTAVQCGAGRRPVWWPGGRGSTRASAQWRTATTSRTARSYRTNSRLSRPSAANWSLTTLTTYYTIIMILRSLLYW